MPNGEWQQMDSSILQDKGAVNYVKQYLTHSLDYSDLYSVSSAEKCFAEETSKEVIGSLQKSDFKSASISFSTKNNQIKVPLDYYKLNTQVNRTSQNYIVEVFLYDNSDPTVFSIIDYVSVSDIRQYNRSFVKNPITYHSYDLYKKLITNDIDFYDSSGGLLKSGTSLSIDSDGTLTTSWGDKVTSHIASVLGPAISTGILYSQVSVTTNESWVKDDNLNASYFASFPYDGIFTIDSSGIASPSSITIVGKTKGSNISVNEILNIKLDPEEVLIMLREFKRLQEDTSSRNAAISSAQYGPEGGSRLNYRVSPMWTEPMGYLTFEQESRQYTKINLEN